jgi:gamma-glutamyltranspeptidase / glutathione hydrolase
MNFNWNFPYPTERCPVFAKNVVATSHPLASHAGLRMLERGGNAVDAALAAAIAITILEPISCGLGSDGFAILWDGKALHGLNASGRSPAAWTLDYFKSLGDKPERGWNSVSIPGAVSAWVSMSEKFGKLPFADLFESAIEYAENGYMVTPIVHKKWVAQVPLLQHQPGFADTFLPHGRAPNVGEQFTMRDAASTLRKIADSKGESFYRGELAATMAKHSQANGGVHTEADFAAHTCDWVGTISQDYRDHTLHEIPPNGQGITALIALGILKHFDLASLDPDGVESQHLQIEAMKLGFAETYAHVADPQYMRFSSQQMLDPDYLASRAKLIDRARATNFKGSALGANLAKGGTIYLTAADASGMMVSFIQSNYMGFGSGVVVPGTGISLQNRGAGFNLDPTHANCVAPNKRPFQTIIPAFLTQQGQPVMSFGVMGGNMQPQGHAQTLVRMLDYGMNPQAACDAPRWRVTSTRDGGLGVNAEITMKPALVAALKAKGHAIAPLLDTYMDYGSGQFAWKTPNGYIAASDSRRDGQAVGF